MSVSEIAGQANSKLSTMTKAVQRMEAGGLVILREGTQDRRVTEVSLSPSGVELVGTAVETARHVFNRAFSGLAPERLVLLRELLEDVADNLR